MELEEAPEPTGTYCVAVFSPTDPDGRRSPIPSQVRHGVGCLQSDVHMLRDTSLEWTSVPPELWQD